MDHKEWRGWQGVNLCDCLLQRGSDIWVCCFVEAHVAVANLDKAQGSLCGVGGAMSHLAISDSTVDCPKQSGPCPSHTFKKTAAINAIIAKVSDNVFCHLPTLHLTSRSDFKEDLWHLLRKQTNWRGVTHARDAACNQMSPVRVGLSFLGYAAPD